MISMLLFWQFLQFGLICFGGGYMMIPLLHKTFVENSAFFTEQEFVNLLTVSQITPGAVSINTATYVGFLKDDFTGAIMATLGLIIPTLLLAIPCLKLFTKYAQSSLIKGGMQGIRIVAFVMILYTSWLFFNNSVLNNPIKMENIPDFLSGDIAIKWIELCVFIATFILTYFFKLTMMKCLLLSLIFGITYSFCPFYQHTTQNNSIVSTHYDADLCRNGIGQTWGGACTCYSENTSGRYCDIKSKTPCSSSSDCATTEYCDFRSNASHCLCFPKRIYKPFHFTHKLFYLSDSIITHKSAVSFCSSLGKNVRTASIQDLHLAV